jgi:hypothetical protein
MSDICVMLVQKLLIPTIIVGTPHFRTSHALISNIIVQTLDFMDGL